MSWLEILKDRITVKKQIRYILKATAFKTSAVI